MINHDITECTARRRSVQDTLEILSGKWKLLIIISLMDGNRRFKELSREIGISPRMLSKELQDLEMNLLITRTVQDTKPVTVEYAITPYANTLQKVLSELSDWGMNHRQKIIHGEAITA